jgi:hypothetical protein
LHDGETFVQRILAGPQLPGERLVDDRHRCGLRAVELGELAPAAQRDSQGVEIVRRHVVELHQRPAVVGVLCLPFGEDGQREATQEGRRRSDGHRFNAGHGARPGHRIEIELLACAWS